LIHGDQVCFALYKAWTTTLFNNRKEISMKANIQVGIDQQEREDLVYGLQMRICVIETGVA
jgi:hypothetical protein